MESTTQRASIPQNKSSKSYAKVPCTQMVLDGTGADGLRVRLGESGAALTGFNTGELPLVLRDDEGNG